WTLDNEFAAHLATLAVDQDVARQFAGRGDELGLIDNAEASLLREPAHGLSRQYHILLDGDRSGFSLRDRHATSLCGRASVAAWPCHARHRAPNAHRTG